MQQLIAAVSLEAVGEPAELSSGDIDGSLLSGDIDGSLALRAARIFSLSDIVLSPEVLSGHNIGAELESKCNHRMPYSCRAHTATGYHTAAEHTLQHS